MILASKRLMILSMHTLKALSDIQRSCSQAHEVLIAERLTDMHNKTFAIRRRILHLRPIADIRVRGACARVTQACTLGRQICDTDASMTDTHGGAHHLRDGILELLEEQRVTAAELNAVAAGLA